MTKWLFSVSCFFTFTLCGQNTIEVPLNLNFARDNSINGDTVLPEDTLVFKSGYLGQFQFLNFNGAQGLPLIITHETGDSVLFNSTTNGYSLAINASRFIKVLGKRTPDQNYFGIQLIADYSNVQLGLNKGTMFTEVDGIYTHGPLFALDSSETRGPAVLVKESLPNNGAPNGLDSTFIAAHSYLVQNIHIHHCHFKNSGTESLYIGETNDNPVTINTQTYTDSLILVFDPITGLLTQLDTVKIPSGSLTFQPHYLDDVLIEYNFIQDAGWDGIQVSRSSNAVIRNNRIEGFGMNVDESVSSSAFVQVHGIVFGAGNSGSVYNNYIERGKGHGIMAKPSGSTSIFNNVIINQGENISANSHPDFDGNADAAIRTYLVEMDKNYNRGANVAGQEKRFAVVHNLIINPHDFGIRCFTAPSPNQNAYNIFLNNVVLESPSLPFQFNGFAEDLNLGYDSLKYRDPLQLNSFNYFTNNRNNAYLQNINQGPPFLWNFVPLSDFFVVSPLINQGVLTNEALYPDYYGRLRFPYLFSGQILDYAIPPNLNQRKGEPAKVEYGPVERTIFD